MPTEQEAIDRMLIELDGTPNKSPPRRQRDPRRLAGRRPRCRGGRGRAALPPRREALQRRSGCRADGAAGADDERAQRRLARRQLGRLPGVHGRPGRRLHVQRVPAGRAPRSSTRSSSTCTSTGSPPRSATRAASLRTCLRTRRRSRPSVAGDHRGRLRGRQGRLHRARPRDQRDLRGRQLRARAREPQPLRRRARRLLGRQGRSLPHHLDRGRHGRGGLGRLEGADRQDRRPLPARRRRPLRHQPRAPRPRHRAPASPTRSWSRSTRSGP